MSGMPAGLSVVAPAAGSVTPSQLTSQAAHTILANALATAASPTAFDVDTDGEGVFREGNVLVSKKVGSANIEASYLSMIDSLATFPSYGTVKGLLAGPGCSDYVRTANGGCPPFTTSVTGTGAAASGVTSAAGRPGIVALSTGTDATGRTSSTTDATAILLGGGVIRYRADIRIPTASDGTNTFTVLCGLVDTVTGTVANGLYARYSHTENSGNLVLVARAGGVETGTVFNTAVNPVHATTFACVEFEVNASASSVAYYVNGSLLATFVANIPTGVALGAMVTILKSLGGTARTVEVDKQGFRFEATTGV